MKEVYDSIDLTDQEKLLLLYLLNPATAQRLRNDEVALIRHAKTICTILGDDRLEDICIDLNDTIYDTQIIIELARRLK